MLEIMGDRGQVLIDDTGVYLYTHWGASDLEAAVREAIGKKQRWDQPEYLARIIFDCMVERSGGEETGFGVGRKDASDAWLLVKIQCFARRVVVIDRAPGSVTKTEYTFDEFINLPKEKSSASGSLESS